MVRAGVPSARGVPSGRSPSTAPALFRITFRRVGKPSAVATARASIAASASSPFGETVKYEPTAPSSRGCASTISTSNPAFWRAMAVTGPATPAPTTSARIVLSFLYHFRIFQLSEDSVSEG